MWTKFTFLQNNLANSGMLLNQFVHHSPEGHTRDRQFFRACEFPQVGIEFYSRHNVMYVVASRSLAKQSPDYEEIASGREEHAEQERPRNDT